MANAGNRFTDQRVLVLVSEPSVRMIVRPPLWFRMLYVGLFIMCLLFLVVAALAFDRATAIDFGFPVLLIAGFMLLIAVTSLTRRLELRGDRLYSVLITGTRWVAVSEIVSMRLSRVGTGMSRVVFLRRDGAPAFGRTRPGWPTSELLRLAEAMNVSVQSA